MRTRSEQIQRIVQINLFPDLQLVLRLRHIIKQKFQNQGAAEAPAFDFEMRKAPGKVNRTDVVDADKGRIFHGFGKAITLSGIRGLAGVLHVFSEIFAADDLVTAFAIPAAGPAAFVAEKFYLVFLCLR